jgi:predicted RNase H-like HicB family nuclease
MMGRMKFYTFEIVIEKEPDDPGYLSYCPALPGCFIEEARTGIREAIQQHPSVLLEEGEEIPQNDSIVHVEELSVGFPS